MTDGIEIAEVMPATQLSHLITDNVVRENSIVKLVSYTQNSVQNAK